MQHVDAVDRGDCVGVRDRLGVSIIAISKVCSLSTLQTSACGIAA